MRSQSAFPICRHTKTNGLRCQSPAQGASAFCYHHRNLRRTPRHRPAPVPSAISNAISIIESQSNTGRIHPYDASLMLQALEFAERLASSPSTSGS